MQFSLSARCVLAVSWIAFAGCTARISGEGPPPDRNASAPGPAPKTDAATNDPQEQASLQQPASSFPAPQRCTNGSPGPGKLRRLTGSQFSATLRRIFDDDAVPNVTVFSDPQVLGFSSDADLLMVQGLTAQQLADYAEQVAHWAVTSKLPTLSSCNSMDATCQRAFIQSFGKRAFREPLSDERVQAYQQLMTAETTFESGAEAVITAMLQSPYFLYRRELGAGTPAAGVVRLSAYEIASSLSYLLLGNMPDDELMRSADDGSLTSQTTLDQQARRLLGDSRSLDSVMDFFSSWLGIGRLDTTVKDDTTLKLSDSLKASMKGESRAFLLDLFQNGGRVADLFTADYTFLNQELAQYYGISTPATANLGANFVKVPLTGVARRDGGILADASLLTGYADAAISSPVFRGKLVRTRLLCEALPPPPANLDTKLRPPTKTETTRQHFDAHRQDPVCAGCHVRMDPIGYAFEHYDAFGRWRDQENGIDVDASGRIVGSSGADVSFNGLHELSSYLAGSDAVKSCVVRFWSYYAYGMTTWEQDACTYDAIQQQATTSDMELSSILMAVLHAPRFTQRLAP